DTLVQVPQIPAVQVSPAAAHEFVQAAPLPVHQYTRPDRPTASAWLPRTSIDSRLPATPKLAGVARVIRPVARSTVKLPTPAAVVGATSPTMNPVAEPGVTESSAREVLPPPPPTPGARRYTSCSPVLSAFMVVPPSVVQRIWPA